MFQEPTHHATRPPARPHTVRSAQGRGLQLFVEVCQSPTIPFLQPRFATSFSLTVRRGVNSIFLSRKVLLNCSLLLRSCDLWLEVALGRFLQHSGEELVTINCLFRSLCANMMHVGAKCRSDVQFASLCISCLSKDQTGRHGNMWPYFLCAFQGFPPTETVGSVMEKRTRSMCIMLQDVFGRNRL